MFTSLFLQKGILKKMPVKYDLKQIPLLQKLNNYGEEGLKTPIRGIEVGTLLQDYVQLTDLLPSIDSPAICDPLNQDRIPLTHKRLKKFITEEYDLTKFGIQHGSRVGILLPNGPELAVALLSTISKWCAAPINATNTWEEIKMELQSTKACAIIILAGVSTNEASLKAAEALGLAVITIASYGKYLLNCFTLCYNLLHCV